MNGLRAFLLVIAVVASIPVWASESGVVIKSCKVLNGPFADAQEIASVKEGDTIEIMTSKGGWLNILTRGKSGWVRMLFVRRGMVTGKPAPGTEASGVLGLATGRSGKGNVVAATGVRGLSEEELKGARFDVEEITRLKTFSTTNSEARSFAQEGGLQPRQVELLNDSLGEK